MQIYHEGYLLWLHREYSQLFKEKQHLRTMRKLVATTTNTLKKVKKTLKIKNKSFDIKKYMFGLIQN